MVLLFVVLGYTGVAVMKTPYYITYSQAVRESVQGALTLRRDSHIPVETLKDEGPKETITPQDAGHSQAGPLVVLVLSSMPRGGSTLLTELLSSVQDSVTFFEPLWHIEKTKCYEDEECTTRYLADVFSCSFKQEFEDWFKAKSMFFHYFSPQARQCQKKRGEANIACLKGMNLRMLCETAPLVVVKVIRARLAWLHNMLEDSLINLKVIHLTRDPRGSLSSIIKFGWDSDPYSRCSGLKDDLDTYEKVRELFPSKVMQVRYEHLCLTPEDTTKGIFRFLYGNATLPSQVTSFLQEHMLSGARKGGNMSTFKNSSQEYQAWRYKIKDKYLKAIEAEPTCVYSIQHMGHALFGSQAAATNPTLPLFVDAT